MQSMGIKLLQHYPLNNSTKVRNNMVGMWQKGEELVEVVS
jgi:hypothetical protein